MRPDRWLQGIVLLGFAAGYEAADPAPIPLKARPVADSNEPFGLIVAGQYGVRQPPGVICFTPGGRAPRVLEERPHGDMIDQELSDSLDQAARHNLAVVERSDYPDADLCRPRLPEDNDLYSLSDPFNGPARMTQPARRVTTPAETLHAAARRGGVADVQRLLRNTPVDAVDGLGLTALSWAVARDRAQITNAVLAAGADPLAAGPEGQSALYWSAALGRGAVFRKLVGAMDAPPVWTRRDIKAALAGGDVSIVRRMLADAHEPFLAQDLQPREVSVATMALILKGDTPGLADALLQEVVRIGHPLRTDLMALAIDHGADVNAQARGAYETPLGAVSDGIDERSPRAVRLLLAAGADPNALSHQTRPIWEAIRILKLDGETTDTDARALEIIDLLIAAGGDINLPGHQGRPPAWVLFFPYAYDHEELDASFVTHDLLANLKARGLDLNAPWQGRRLLSAVEEKAGVQSDQAVWLRELGARR